MSAVMNALIISAEGTNTVTTSEKNPDNKVQIVWDKNVDCNMFTVYHRCTLNLESSRTNGQQLCVMTGREQPC